MRRKRTDGDLKYARFVNEYLGGDSVDGDNDDDGVDEYVPCCCCC